MRKAFVFLAPLLLLIVACSSSKELTRSKASALINAKPDFATTKVLPVEPHTFDKMIADKLFVQPGSGQWWQPSQETRAYITSLSNGGYALAKPLSRSVAEIDGISPGPDEGTKVASFTYHYNDVPPFISQHAAITSDKIFHAEALFKTYDDGWRVEEVEYK